MGKSCKSVKKTKAYPKVTFEIAPYSNCKPNTRSITRGRSVSKNHKNPDWIVQKIPEQKPDKFIKKFNLGLKRLIKEGIDYQLLNQSDKETLESILSKVSSTKTQSVNDDWDKFTEVQLDCSKSEIPNTKINDESSLGQKSTQLEKRKRKRINKKDNKQFFEEMVSITIPETSSSEIEVSNYTASELPILRAPSLSKISANEAEETKSEIWKSSMPLSNSASKSTFSIKIKLPYVDQVKNDSKLLNKPLKDWCELEIKQLMKEFNTESTARKLFNQFSFPLHVRDRIGCLMRDIKYF